MTDFIASVAKTSDVGLRARARPRWTPASRACCRQAVRCKSSTNVQDKANEDSADGVGLMELPSRAGVPVMGMFGYLWEKNLDLSELHAELGPTFAVNLGLPMGGWHLATCDPEVVRDVLNSPDDRFYASWPEPIARLVFPRERSFTDAEAKPWRRILSSVLSPEVVMSLQLPLMVQDLTTQMRAITSAGEEVSWHQQARRIAFGVATRAVVGPLVTEEEMDDLCEMYSYVGVTSALSFGFRDGIPGTPFYKSVQSRKAIEEVLYAKIKPAIDDPDTFGGQRCAVLRMYQASLAEQEAGAPSMTNAEIAKMLAQDAFFLMFAGTDTTSYNIMKCALALEKHPQWFQKLKEEQDALRAEFGDVLDRKVLSRSHMATAMALEVLRLNTPAASLFRRAARDTTAGGVLIPEGGRVIVNLRQPSQTTGSGMLEVDPSHWIKADGTARDNSSKDNLSFGVGPRRCVGQSLATVEVITTLAIMAREVDTIAVAPEEHDIDFGASTAHPTGIPMRFTAREPATVDA